MEQDFNRILSRTWLNIVIKCLNAESIFELKFQKFELSLHFFRDIPSMMYVTSSDFSSLLYVNIPDFSSLRHFLFFIKIDELFVSSICFAIQNIF